MTNVGPGKAFRHVDPCAAIEAGADIPAATAGRHVPGEWPEASPQGEDESLRLSDEDTIESVVAEYQEQIAASREILGSFDLDALCARQDLAQQNVRWVAIHMIEETARHAGHADIIRETIDGTRGL